MYSFRPFWLAAKAASQFSCHLVIPVFILDVALSVEIL